MKEKLQEQGETDVPACKASLAAQHVFQEGSKDRFIPLPAQHSMCSRQGPKTGSISHYRVTPRACPQIGFYLAGGQVGGLHIDGGEQVLKQHGRQFEVLRATKIVHDHERRALPHACRLAWPLQRRRHVAHKRVRVDAHRQRRPLRAKTGPFLIRK